MSFKAIVELENGMEIEMDSSELKSKKQAVKVMKRISKRGCWYDKVSDPEHVRHFVFPHEIRKISLQDRPHPAVAMDHPVESS